MTTTPRIAVLTVAGLAEHLAQLAERAMDAHDRDAHTTDETLQAQLSLMMSIADNAVWACESDYSEGEPLPALRTAHIAAEKAWRYLRSGAPALQRTLTRPTGETADWLMAQYTKLYRRGAAWCECSDSIGWLYAEIQDKRGSAHAVRRLPLPVLMGKCTQLADARRTLAALGLKTTIEGDRLTCAALPEAHVTRYSVST